MKAIITIIFLLPAIYSQAQTTAQKIARLDSIVKAQSASIAALNNTQVMIFDMIGKQQKELESFKNGIVKSNQIVGYWPIVVKDSTDTIKVIYLAK